MVELSDKKLLYLVGALQECEDCIIAERVITKAMKYGYKLFDDFNTLLTEEEQVIYKQAYDKIKDLKT